MAIYDSHASHRFCWADICTPDRITAKLFYGGLFGWEFQDLFMPGGVYFYTMITMEGHNVAGMNELQPEQVEAGMSAYWNSYVCVKDVRASLANCLELGAEVLYEAVNILEIGSMAMLKAPGGATFSLWQPREHKGMQVMNQPGAACWFELVSNDVSASAKFYESAFGWKSTSDLNEPAYTNLMRPEAAEGEELVGGMMKIEQEWGDVSPNWAVYFLVDSVDDSLAQALNLGGEPLHDPIDIPNERLITMRDPMGGVFALQEITGKP